MMFLKNYFFLFLSALFLLPAFLSESVHARSKPVAIFVPGGFALSARDFHIDYFYSQYYLRDDQFFIDGHKGEFEGGLELDLSDRLELEFLARGWVESLYFLDTPTSLTQNVDVSVIHGTSLTVEAPRGAQIEVTSGFLFNAESNRVHFFMNNSVDRLDVLHAFHHSYGTGSEIRIRNARGNVEAGYIHRQFNGPHLENRVQEHLFVLTFRPKNRRERN